MDAIEIGRGASRIVLCVDRDGTLRQVGFGPSAAAGELPFPAELYPQAYPTYGDDPFAMPALRVTQASGAVTTRLVFQETTREKRAGGEQVCVALADEHHPLVVRMMFRTWDDDDVLEQWVEVHNGANAAITLHEMAAAAPLFAGSDMWVDHFTGDWGAEFVPVHEKLSAGTKVLDARATTRPSHERPPYVTFRPDGAVTETSGVVLAAALAWGGNTRIAFDVTVPDRARATFGHLPVGADYTLDAGSTFETPHVIWAWSDAGTRPLTHRFHHWIRTNILRHGKSERPIVVNNWEATGFAFDEARLVAFCNQTASLGGEVFLLDDGWFGVEHPRVDDTAGLGDWEANPTLLPNGLAPIGAAAQEAGIRFGVWIEPEMVNPDSVLYATHPDWVVTEPGRTRREERNQLQLDLCRPDVQRFVTNVADEVLEPTNNVSFLKWDANRMVTEPGSTALSRDRQSNWPVDIVRATWDVMHRVAAKHPDTEMMLCASGGGRMDLGTLKAFHEVWLSDNTDPVDRVAMQWHASQFLPVSSLAAHVTRWGQRPVAFGCAVAMSARFGFDINPDGLDEIEYAICQRASAHYKQLRSTIQHGDLFRLISPEAGPSVALAFSDSDRKETVVFAYRLPGIADQHPDQVPTVLALDFLDQSHPYLVHTIDLLDDTPARAIVIDGADLNSRGLAWDLSDACTAQIWRVQER